MFRSLVLIGVATVSATVAASAQTANTPPSPPAQNRQFDFWIGTWSLTWEGGTGTNTIRRECDGAVVVEDFAAQTGSALKGMSVSVFDARAGQWRQAWVDNQGSYLDFTGGLEGDRMVLSRKANVQGKDIVQRMVWYNIAQDTFDWNWERSDDEGKTWTVVWKIHYARRS